MVRPGRQRLRSSGARRGRSDSPRARTPGPPLCRRTPQPATFRRGCTQAGGKSDLQGPRGLTPPGGRRGECAARRASRSRDLESVPKAKSEHQRKGSESLVSAGPPAPAPQHAGAWAQLTHSHSHSHRMFTTMFTHTYPLTSTPSYAHMFVNTRRHTHMYMLTRTHIHAHTHIHEHTHMLKNTLLNTLVHTHTLTLAPSKRPGLAVWGRELALPPRRPLCPREHRPASQEKTPGRPGERAGEKKGPGRRPHRDWARPPSLHPLLPLAPGQAPAVRTALGLLRETPPLSPCISQNVSSVVLRPPPSHKGSSSLELGPCHPP